MFFKRLYYHWKCTIIKLQFASCFVYTYAAISILRYKLNRTLTDFPGSVLLRGDIFILITPSTKSYQVPMSVSNKQLDTLSVHTLCLYLRSHFSSAFMLNLHFPGASLLRAGVSTLLTPSISCAYCHTFLPISLSV